MLSLSVTLRRLILAVCLVAWPVAQAAAQQFGGWTFGCDVCNEVCPWNLRFATEYTVPEFRPRGDLREAGEDFFERMTEGEFQAWFADTPLARPGLARMRRNWRLAWASLRGAQRRAAAERQ